MAASSIIRHRTTRLLGASAAGSIPAASTNSNLHFSRSACVPMGLEPILKPPLGWLSTKSCHSQLFDKLARQEAGVPGSQAMRLLHRAIGVLAILEDLLDCPTERFVR